MAYPERNAAAKAMKYPDPPPGHHYREKGTGFELTRFGPRSKEWRDVTPKRVVWNESEKAWKVEDNTRALTIEQRRAEIIQRYPPANEKSLLESALPQAHDDPYVHAYARMHANAFASLERQQAGSTQAILDGLKNLSVGEAERAIRRGIREQAVRLASAPTDGAERMRRLHAFLDAMPEEAPAARGALFSAFRQKNMPAGLELVPDEINATKFTDPVNANATRQADGMVDVIDPVKISGRGRQGPTVSGRFYAEDKAGGGFRLDQAEAYSAALAKSGGKISAVDGREYNGVLYFFSDKAHALAATKKMDELKLSSNIHVAFYDTDGALRWVR